MIYKGDLRREGITWAKEKLVSQQLNESYAGLLVLHSIMQASKLSIESAASWFKYLDEGILRSGFFYVNIIVQEIQGIDESPQPALKLNAIFVG